MKKILIASDLSERSERALARGLALARTHNASVHVLYVIDVELPLTVAQELKSAATETLGEQIARHCDPDPVETRIEILFGTVWETIVETSVATHADLLVLGTHRARGIAELFRGTTVERVAKEIAIPTLIAGGPATLPYNTVLVGVDFSNCSRRAIDFAARLAPGAEMVLLNAYHVPFKHFTQKADPDGSIARRDRTIVETELGEQMKSFEAGLTSRPEQVRHVFVEGGPAPALLQEAAKRDSDLICVGVHGRSWLAEAFLGSTANQLMVDAARDTLVVPL